MALSLQKLNAPQREAVLHRDGPLLILAGAGSGKTSTMTYRIAHLIAERNVSPLNILGLSFTNKAANELKERVTRLVGTVSQQSRGLTISTFHALCVRLLRAHAEKIGYRGNFTILDQGDQLDVVKYALKHLNIDDRKFDAYNVLFRIGQTKNRFLQGAEAEAFLLGGARDVSDYSIASASVYPRYQEHLKALNAMDFDDLLFNAVRLLSEHAEVRSYYNKKFRYILVDEYQDTNSAQFKLLRLLTEQSQNICVVGDDDQSIYAWRGADPSHILGFGKQFPGARMITLDQNYRSTTTILDAANSVISQNSLRHPKKLWSSRGEGEPIFELVAEEDREEGEIVAEEILKHARTLREGQMVQTRAWSDFAILYRSNAQSRIFEEALRRHSIPYKLVGGMSFLERKEIKDVLSYWRLVLNPRDDASARRIVNWPPRGIGRTAIQKLGDHAVATSKPFLEALGDVATAAPKAAAAVGEFRALIHKLVHTLHETPPTPQALSQWALKSFEWIEVKKGLEADTEDSAKVPLKWENIEELAHSLGQLKPEDDGVPLTAEKILRDYLQKLALEAKEDLEDEKEKKENRDQVTLLTLHGAKGLEYPIVFLVGMEDGLLPHQKTIDHGHDLSEERRLCYVGITRARDLLYITRTRFRIKWGKQLPRHPSRFLSEIPKNLLLSRDTTSVPDPSNKKAHEEHEARVKGFLSQIRGSLGQ